MNRNKNLTILHFFSNTASLIWLLVGCITLGGIYLSRIGLLLNFLFGLFFVWIGMYLYKKQSTLSKFLAEIDDSRIGLLYKKVIMNELIFNVFALLFGLMAITAVSSRVFGEGFAVFG